MSFDLGLNGKRAVVTGGTKGPGAALVASLRDAGAEVMTSARSAPGHPVPGVSYVVADLATLDGVSMGVPFPRFNPARQRAAAGSRPAAAPGARCQHHAMPS